MKVRVFSAAYRWVFLAVRSLSTVLSGSAQCLQESNLNNGERLKFAS